MQSYAFSYCDIVSIIELCVCTDVDQLSLRVCTINPYHAYDCCCDFVCINELCVCTDMSRLSYMYARG